MTSGSDDGFDIVAFGRRDLVTGSRAKQRSPRFWWVSDVKTFYRELAKADDSARVLALEEPSKLTSLGKCLEDHLAAFQCCAEELAW